MLKMGVIDNGVLALSFYCVFISLDKHFEKYFNRKLKAILCGCVSACIANTISDYLGFALQGQFQLANYVALGCIIGMAVIPICEMFNYINHYRGIKNEK